MIVQGGLVRPIVNKLGERRTMILGLVAGAVGFAIYGFAPTGTIFWLGLPIMAFWGLTSPAAQGIMTRSVAPTEQGQLQGAAGSIMGITGIIGPALFTQTLAASIGPTRGLDLPGSAFLLAALLLALAALIGGRAAAAAKPAAAAA